MKNKDLEPWAKTWMYITMGLFLSMIIPHWRGVIIIILIPTLFFGAWILWDYLKKKEIKKEKADEQSLKVSLPPKWIAYVLLGIIIAASLALLLIKI